MTVRALRFSLSNRQTNSRVGLALLVPAAHYMAIAWTATAPLERRYADPDGWRLLQRAITGMPPATTLPPTHVIVRMLLLSARRREVVVHYLGDDVAEMAAHDNGTRYLDDYLLKHFACAGDERG